MKVEYCRGIKIEVQKLIWNKVFSAISPKDPTRVDLATCDQHAAHERAMELAT